jgi:hypothetical protein
MSADFRPVNRTLGVQPKIGPFALHQVAPFLFSVAFTYALKDLLGFDWLVAALLVGAMTGGSLALLGNHPWRFFAQIKPCPRVVRGGCQYRFAEVKSQKSKVKRQK